MTAPVALGAQYLIVLPVLLFIAALLEVPSDVRKGFLGHALLACALAFLMAKALGAAVYDPRPFMVLHRTPLVPHAAESGMPSDHCLLAFALAFLTLRVSRPLGVASLIASTLLAAARVACLLHSPLQVSAGAAVAALGVATATVIVSKSSPSDRALSR